MRTDLSDLTDQPDLTTKLVDGCQCRGRRPRRPRLGHAVAAAGIAGIAAAAGGVAGAATGTTATISGCYANAGGQLRVISGSQTCATTETPLQWNQQGPAGPQGPAGEGHLYRMTGDVGSIGTAPTVVASIALPAGSYALDGRVRDQGTSGVSVQCETDLRTGAFPNFHTTFVDYDTNTLGAGFTEFAVLGQVTVPAGGGLLQVSCGKSGNGTVQARADVHALSVGTLQ